MQSILLLSRISFNIVSFSTVHFINFLPIPEWDTESMCSLQESRKTNAIAWNLDSLSRTVLPLLIFVPLLCSTFLLFKAVISLCFPLLLIYSCNSFVFLIIVSFLLLSWVNLNSCSLQTILDKIIFLMRLWYIYLSIIFRISYYQ